MTEGEKRVDEEEKEWMKRRKNGCRREERMDEEEGKEGTCDCKVGGDGVSANF